MDKDKKFFEVVVSAFLLALTVFLLYISYTSPSTFVADGLASMDFPKSVFYIQAVLCLIVLVNSVKKYLLCIKEERSTQVSDKVAKTPLINSKVLISIILIIIYVFLWDYLGFILSSFIFFTVESRILDKEKALWKCVIIGLLVALLSYVIFGILFQVSFPEPLLDLFLG
ncbi:MAG TPA: tripartite tricarboxylate transporter TctB family protein [Peptococcaceae bacterium]|nr:tripartite tricarboxylate transporter TctB family protein [Peptococcaceae bacterium]